LIVGKRHHSIYNPSVTIDNFGTGGVIIPLPQFDSNVAGIQTKPIKMGVRGMSFAFSSY